MFISETESKTVISTELQELCYAARVPRATLRRIIKKHNRYENYTERHTRN